MKIVLITPYWTRTKGGITTVAVSLSAALRSLGHSVVVLTPDGGDGAIQLSRGYFFAAGRIVRLISNIAPDAIHVHGHGSLLLPAVLYKRVFDRRVTLVYTFHTQPPLDSRSNGKVKPERNRLRSFLFNALLKNCDHVTCVSRSLKEKLIETGVAAQSARIIFSGVEKKAVSSKEIDAFRATWDLAGRYPVLCMVASLVWDWKAQGVSVLLRAFRQVLATRPDAVLLIVGDGRYRRELEELANTINVGRRAIFTGMMENPFVAFSVSTIYCHVSSNEALPVAPLEAMAAGMAVVASNAGGFPEIIESGRNGILTETREDSVASAILALSDDPDRIVQLGSAAESDARDRFSWPRISQDYLDLYRSPKQ